MPDSPAMPTAAVIGAGIAGLVSAKRLVDAGYAVEIFEATDRTGGLIAPAQIGEINIDVGAESFAVSTPVVAQLCAELGIENLVVSPQRSDARILSTKGAYLIPHGVLGIPSNLDDPALAEAVGQVAVDQAKQLDAEPWVSEPEVTIGQLVKTRLGQSFVDAFLTPVIAGVHSSDAQKLEAATVAPGLLAKASELGSLVAAVAEIRKSAARPGAAVASIAGGMHQLVAALESSLRATGVTFHFNHKVVTASQLNQFDKVVLACGVDGAAQLLADQPELQELLSQVTAVDAAVVALLVESSQLNDYPRGSGVLVASDVAGVSAKAATHVNAKWQWVQQQLRPNQHILRFSFGRNGLLPAAPEELAQLATADAKTIFGITELSVLDSVTQVWPKALVQAGPGHALIVNRVREALMNNPRIEIIGAGLGGNGITGILSGKR